MDHQWKRFWYLRGTSPALEEEGFLIDPDAEYGKIFNPDALSFDCIAEKPCLVLLGEPGIGKSHELGEIVKRRPQESGPDRIFIHRNLGDYSTDSALVEDLFGAPDFKAWVRNNQELELFLDSLDESMLHVKTVARLLGNHLARYAEHKGRLKLRIACRTAVWPSTLEAQLKQIWENSEVEVY